MKDILVWEEVCIMNQWVPFVVRNLVNYVYVGKWMPSFLMTCCCHFSLVIVGGEYRLLIDEWFIRSIFAGGWTHQFLCQLLTFINHFKNINAVCPRERNVIKIFGVELLNLPQDRKKDYRQVCFVMHYDFTAKLKCFFCIKSVWKCNVIFIMHRNKFYDNQ